MLSIIYIHCYRDVRDIHCYRVGNGISESPSSYSHIWTNPIPLKKLKWKGKQIHFGLIRTHKLVHTHTRYRIIASMNSNSLFRSIQPSFWNKTDKHAQFSLMIFWQRRNLWLRERAAWVPERERKKKNFKRIWCRLMESEKSRPSSK